MEAVRRLRALRSSRRRLVPAAALAVSACLTLLVLGNAAKIAATDAVLPNVQARVARTAALLSISIPKVTTEHHEAAPVLRDLGDDRHRPGRFHAADPATE
jgi:hypothetical protein